MVEDGDLFALVQNMIRTGVRETVRVTKVEGHAEDVGVQQGRVRLEDQMGNAEADTPADLGRRHQTDVLIDAWRRLLNARSCWYPIMLDLHRFMIAVARVTVNHDGREGGVLLLIPLFGIRVESLSLASLLLGFLWTVPLFPALLVSKVVPGFRFMVIFLVMILLPGLTVLVFWLDLLLFSIPCSGLLFLMTWATLFFFFGASYPFRAMGWTSVAPGKVDLASC